MTALSVSPHERGRIRVFAADLDETAFNRIKNPKTDMPPTGAAIGALVGLEWLNPDHAEIFPVEDLEELGLANYLIDGAGVAPKDVTPLRRQLDAVEGYVLVLYSRAFDGQATALKLSRQLSLIATLTEDTPDITFAPLPTASAKGIVASQAPTPKVANPHMILLWVVCALPLLALMIGALVWGLS